MPSFYCLFWWQRKGFRSRGGCSQSVQFQRLPEACLRLLPSCSRSFLQDGMFPCQKKLTQHYLQLSPCSTVPFLMMSTIFYQIHHFSSKLLWMPCCSPGCLGLWYFLYTTLLKNTFKIKTSVKTLKSYFLLCLTPLWSPHVTLGQSWNTKLTHEMLSAEVCTFFFWFINFCIQPSFPRSVLDSSTLNFVQNILSHTQDMKGTFFVTIFKLNWAEDVSQLARHFPSIHEEVSSIPSIAWTGCSR